MRGGGQSDRSVREPGTLSGAAVCGGAEGGAAEAAHQERGGSKVPVLTGT